MTKYQVDKILYKIYRMLKEIPMQFRLNRKMSDHGITCVYDNHPETGAAIYVDPEKREFMGTVLHECLHLVDWDMEEEHVAKLERDMMKKLTDRQLMNLLKRVIMKHTKKRRTGL